MRINGIIVFALIAVFSCTTKVGEEELLFGDWSYEKIEKNEEEFIEVTRTDVLNLERDFLFSYHVDKANKHKQGSWTFSGDTLHLSYDLEGVKRDFVVTQLTEDKMVFHEGPLYFHFKRIAE